MSALLLWPLAALELTPRILTHLYALTTKKAPCPTTP